MDAKAVSSSGLCSARWLRPFVQAMGERSVDVEGELRGLGLDRVRLTTDAWVSQARVAETLERASQSPGFGTLGLRAAECLIPGDFDVLEYVAATCGTLGEAIRAGVRFMHLMDPGSALSLQVSGDTATLCYHMESSIHSVTAVEFVLASMLFIGRRLTGEPLCPQEVHFRHDLPARKSSYERSFGATVRFGAGKDAMIFAASALDMPLTRPEPVLHSILERHATALAERLPSRRSFKQKVLDLIAEELMSGNPGVENLARRLEISTRTFLRRLKAEDASHRELVTGVRRAMAVQYLTSSEMSMSEIAFALGFSTSNSFHKAFRQWFGTTPVAYRRDEGERASGELKLNESFCSLLAASG